MRRSVFYMLFLAVTGTHMRVKADAPKFEGLSNQIIFGLSVGQYEFRANGLNNQLSDWGLQLFHNYYYTTGLTYAGPVSFDRMGNFDAAFTFEGIVNQEISTPNDSLRLRLQGWHLTTSIFGVDLVPGDVVALVVGPGFDWGTLKIKRITNGGESKYKNPFVAPMARADLRFTFGRLAIGGRAMYRFDITSGAWKRKTAGMPELRATKNTGPAFEVYLGLRLNKKVKK
jgi:hypothetical protein